MVTKPNPRTASGSSFVGNDKRTDIKHTDIKHTDPANWLGTEEYLPPWHSSEDLAFPHQYKKALALHKFHISTALEDLHQLLTASTPHL
jgi:hypothetical protein